MKKYIIWGSAVFVIVVIALALVFFGRRATPPAEVGTTPSGTLPAIVPSVNVPPPPAGDTLDVSTPQGKVVVKNFYSVGQMIPHYDGVYIVENDNYKILGFERGKGFLIAINNNPVDLWRKQAEQELLRQLNITQEDACKLHVEVHVDKTIRPDLAGLNLGLSFCKN